MNRPQQPEVGWPPDNQSFGPIFGQAFPVAADRDLIRAVVDFANGDIGIATDTFSEIARAEIKRLGFAGQMAFSEAPIDQVIGRDREHARLLLSAAIDDFRVLADYLRESVRIHPYGLGVSKRAVIEITSSGDVSVRWLLEISDVPGLERRFEYALSYVAALLYTDEFQCRSKLRCCKLDSCGRFFYFEREPGKAGRPRDSYCSSEHMNIAHEKDSSRRHREAKRKRIEAAEARKKQRRRHK